MNLHLAIEGVLDDAKAAIRALIAAEADPVSSTDHPADPTVNPPADAATNQPSDQPPTVPVVSPDAPVSESAPTSEPPAAPTA